MVRRFSRHLREDVTVANSTILDEGWDQIRVGIALITWSKLASWEALDFRFSPSLDKAFEASTGHAELHQEYGRLLAWIAFGIGGEYLAKGACLVRGTDLTQSSRVIKVPESGDNLMDWARRVIAKDDSVYETVTGFGTFGQVPVREISGHGSGDLPAAAVKWLASAVRNRDAHRYVRGVRQSHFHAVELLLVPAFNALIGALDPAELRGRLAGTQAEPDRRPQRSVAQLEGSVTFIDRIKSLTAETAATNDALRLQEKARTLAAIGAGLERVASRLEADVEADARGENKYVPGRTMGQVTYLCSGEDGKHVSVTRTSTSIGVDDIRKTSGFATLALRCAELGLDLQLDESKDDEASLYEMATIVHFVVTVKGWKDTM